MTREDVFDRLRQPGKGPEDPVEGLDCALGLFVELAAAVFQLDIQRLPLLGVGCGREERK